MPKEPPRKGKAPESEPSGARDVTTSQIVSTRDIAQPPASPPPARPPRRSTTHGVGWYGSEDDDELALPRRGRSKRLFLAVFVLVVLGGGAAVFVVWRGQKAKGAAGAAGMPDAAVVTSAAGVAAVADAATPRMAHLRLTSTPPGAAFVVDGKPAGTSPVTIDAPEKATIVIEATLAQHQPWRQEVVVAADTPPIEARLVASVADAGVAGAAAPDAAVPPPSKKVQPARSTKSTKSKAKKKATPTRSKPRTTTKKRTTR
jgi:hypothetical protein